MVFQPVRAEDKNVIDHYMKLQNSASCEMAFATLYLWRDFYQVEYTIIEDLLVVKSVGEEEPSFSFPIGKGNIEAAIEKLQVYCQENNWNLTFHCVDRAAADYLEENHAGQYEIRFDRDEADYIYDKEALVHLRGRKYHGKKNHINKFMKTYEWKYEVVNEDNLDECLAMLEMWYEQNYVPGDLEKAEEVRATKMALTEREFLGLKAGLIRADGNVVAFSVGEALNEDTFAVHFEKAYADVPGAYTMINQQFLLHEAEGYAFANREDDVGDPGLRKAKLSYHPIRFEEKGIAVLKGV